MKIMLTGGSGHVGRRVLTRLVGPNEVVNIDRVAHPLGWSGRQELLDLTQPSQLDRIQETFDAIVHLAAIPHHCQASGEEVLQNNLLSTYAVLRYAVERGVPKVIFASSDSASGWGPHAKWHRPDYLPIDEKHPSLPSEVHGYAKAFGEQLCQGFSRAYGLRTICLRCSFITAPACYERFLKRLSSPEPREAPGATYAWVDVEDVASAIIRALEYDPGVGKSETFYITAAEHYGTAPTLDLIRRNWGEGIPVDRAYYEENARAPFFDIRKAKSLMGWEPEWSVERMIRAHG